MRERDPGAPHHLESAASESDCDRLAAALLDGRFLEDPAGWRPHVHDCAACRRHVAGLFLLRDRMRVASEEAPIERPVPDAPEVVRRAFQRYEARRRRGTLSVCVLAALVGAGLVFLLAREPGAPPVDAMAYARSLHDRVFGSSLAEKQRAPDPEILGRDEPLRREYLEALDHRSGAVRRAALAALMASRIEVDAAHIERALDGGPEDPDVGIVLAAAEDGGQRRTEILDARRAQTLRVVLTGITTLEASGKPPVPPEVILRYVRDPEPEVRSTALHALRWHPAYRPGPEVESILARDPDLDVRTSAADLLLEKAGPEGPARLIEVLRRRPDPPLEFRIGRRLGGCPEGLAFARERLASPETSCRAAVSYMWAVHRGGDRTPPEAWIEKALADPESETFYGLVLVATEANWTGRRSALQERWASMPDGDLRTGNLKPFVAAMLARWDSTSGDPARLSLALDLATASRTTPMRPVVEALATSSVPEVRDRASKLLADWPKP